MDGKTGLPWVLDPASPQTQALSTMRQRLKLVPLLALMILPSCAEDPVSVCTSEGPRWEVTPDPIEIAVGQTVTGIRAGTATVVVEGDPAITGNIEFDVIVR